MVVVTNLNRRLDGPQDKAVQEGKPVNKGFTGPTRPAQDFNRPDPFFGKFDTNIRSDTFYKEFPLVDAQQAQANYNALQGSYGNSFSEYTNAVSVVSNSNFPFFSWLNGSFRFFWYCTTAT